MEGLKRESKPKGDVSHQHYPGQGKTGRVNASESSLRLRNLKLPDTMTDPDGNSGSAGRPVTVAQWPGCPHAPGGDTMAPE